MNEFHILDGHEPVPVDMTEWSLWFASADRKVAVTDLPDGTKVSTVFLGLDHSFGEGQPELFETMVFRNGSGEECVRYATWDEALAGHNRLVEQLT